MSSGSDPAEGTSAHSSGAPCSIRSCKSCRELGSRLLAGWAESAGGEEGHTLVVRAQRAIHKHSRCFYRKVAPAAGFTRFPCLGTSPAPTQPGHPRANSQHRDTLSLPRPQPQPSYPSQGTSFPGQEELEFWPLPGRQFASSAAGFASLWHVVLRAPYCSQGLQLPWWFSPCSAGSLAACLPALPAPRPSCVLWGKATCGCCYVWMSGVLVSGQDFRGWLWTCCQPC